MFKVDSQQLFTPKSFLLQQLSESSSSKPTAKAVILHAGTIFHISRAKLLREILKM